LRKTYAANAEGDDARGNQNAEQLLIAEERIRNVSSGFFHSSLTTVRRLSIASTHFLTQTTFRAWSARRRDNIMALGMTMIIIAGGIDLS